MDQQQQQQHDETAQHSQDEAEATAEPSVIIDPQACAEPLLSEARVSEVLGVSPVTLRSWRCRGVGPAFIKMGSGTKAPVRYAESDIDKFIEQNRQVPSL
jgi:hypothetical protein